MLIKGTDIIGLKIISIKEGREINKIEDLVYDPDTKQIKALITASSGLFSGSKFILPEDIKSIGKNAIIIESEDKIKKMAEIDKKIADIAKNNNYITKTKVITEDGSELGYISDMIFETSNGNVDKIEVSRGLKDLASGKRYININDIITIGKDVIIVKTGIQAKMAEQEETQPGGVEGFIKEGVEDIKESMPRSDYINQEKNELKEKVEEIKDVAKSKIEEVQESIEEKRKEDVVGRYLTVNILSFSDEFIARRGDLITHSLLEEAEKNGILNQVLNNTSEEPIDM